MLPYFCRANRLAASPVSLNTNDVDWWIGTAREPWMASGTVPACRARVRNPNWRSLVMGWVPLSGCGGRRGGWCGGHRPARPADFGDLGYARFVLQAGG